MFSLLFNNKSIEINGLGPYYVLHDYYFPKKSTLNLTFIESNCKLIYIGLFEKSELNRFWNPYENYSKICSNKKVCYAKRNGTIRINSENNSISFWIINEKEYNIVINPCCNYNLNSHLKIYIDSFDFRIKNIIIIAPKLVVFSFITFGLLIFIGIFVSKRLFIPILHIPLLCSLFVRLLINSIIYFLFKYNQKQFFCDYIFLIFVVLEIFAQIIIIFSTLIFSNDAHCSIFIILYSIISAFLITPSYIFTFFLSIDNLVILLSIIQTLTFFLFLYFVYFYIHKTEINLLAYQKVIMSFGIDPMQAPTRIKLLSIYRFNYLFISFVSLRIFLLVSDVFFNIRFDIIYVLYNTLDILFICVFFIISFPRNITKDDLKKMDFESEETKKAERKIFIEPQKDMKQQYRKWEAGDNLPFPPFIPELDYNNNLSVNQFTAENNTLLNNE